MKKILMTAIMISISEVMETMFFLPVEFDTDSSLCQSGMNKDDFACRLSFTGDSSGHLTIVAPKRLVAEMAENFMGEARGLLTDELLSGTLAEMLNMVCGNALSKTDSKIPFELGIPQMVQTSKILEKEVFTIVETTESKMAVHLKMD